MLHASGRAQMVKLATSNEIWTSANLCCVATPNLLQSNLMPTMLKQPPLLIVIADQAHCGTQHWGASAAGRMETSAVRAVPLSPLFWDRLRHSLGRGSRMADTLGLRAIGSREGATVQELTVHTPTVLRPAASEGSQQKHGTSGNTRPFQTGRKWTRHWLRRQ